MPAKLTVTGDIEKELNRRIRAITKPRLLVGIPASKGLRNDGSKLTNAQIGYILDQGSPAANIPPRHWLVPGMEDALPQAIEILRAGAVKTMAGDLTAIDQAFTKAGLVAVNAVRAKINSNIQPALAPSTLKSRRSRGRTGTNTLVDTGGLRNSVTYVVEKKGSS